MRSVQTSWTLSYVQGQMYIKLLIHVIIISIGNVIFNVVGILLPAYLNSSMDVKQYINSLQHLKYFITTARVSKIRRFDYMSVIIQYCKRKITTLGKLQRTDK